MHIYHEQTLTSHTFFEAKNIILGTYILYNGDIQLIIRENGG